MKQPKIKFAVYGDQNDGSRDNRPSKVFDNVLDAIEYAKEQKGKIAWGYPRIYEVTEKRITTYLFKREVRYF